MVSRCACRAEFDMSANKMFCNPKMVRQPDASTTQPHPTATITTMATPTTMAPMRERVTTTIVPAQLAGARDRTPTPATTRTTTTTITTPTLTSTPTTTTPTTTRAPPTTTSGGVIATTGGAYGVTDLASRASSSEAPPVSDSSSSKLPTTEMEAISAEERGDLENGQMDKVEKEKNKYEIIVSSSADDTNNGNNSIASTVVVDVQPSDHEQHRLTNVSRPTSDGHQPVMADDVTIQSGAAVSTSTHSTLLSSRAPETITWPTTVVSAASSTTAAAASSVSTSGSTTTEKHLAPIVALNISISTSATTPDSVEDVSEESAGQQPYRATSLGKRCQHRKECQMRDPYSDCIEGVCECQRPTSQCGAKSTGCLEDTFQCRNGQCISWYFVCDKFKNCDDGSDEDECQQHPCPKEAFQCDDGTCLARSKVCNGHWECPDGSDEARCYKGSSCDAKAFRCQNGQCLPQYAFCNAVEDCVDGSDEVEETCENNNMAQISTAVVSATSRQRKYHKKFQMGTNSLGRAASNEDDPYRNSATTTTPGNSTNNSVAMGGGDNTPFKCPKSSFTCANGKCRSTAILCSGVDGCGDGSDEDRCEVCSCEPPLAPAIFSPTSRSQTLRGRLK